MPQAPAGAPPFKIYRRAYRELMEKLWYAAELFQNEGDGGLEGAKTACWAVKDYIAVRHENPELAAPFIAIAAAFEDLERGKTPALFSTDVTPKQRSGSAEHQRLITLAVTIFDVLIILDKSREPRLGRERLAGLVADAVCSWPGMSATKAITVINWRDQMKARSPQDKQQFEALRTYLLDLPDPQSEVEKMLRQPPGAAKT